ncbi:rRNA biogenesis protein rrp36 [Agyrium rufum]|nr:rRNA biogenesis protein rrp36 [Agyrium rufum]
MPIIPAIFTSPTNRCAKVPRLAPTYTLVADMAPSAILQRRVRVQKHAETSASESGDRVDIGRPAGEESAVDDAEPENSVSAESNTDDENDDGNVSDRESVIFQASSPPTEGTTTPLSKISFGALAAAQSSLSSDTNSRKRKRTTQSQSRLHTTTSKEGSDQDSSKSHSAPEEMTQPPRPYNSGSSRPIPQPRSSKHAPTEQTSKRAVPRARQILTSTRLKPQDPRFTPLPSTAPTDPNRFAQTYSFLTQYRTSELSTLKAALGKTKDPLQIAQLRKTIQSMQSQEETRRKKEAEQEVIRDHRKREKEAVERGEKKKAFFLKKGDVRTEVQKRRFEGLGEKARDRVVARREKKMAGKEKKSLPRERRSGGSGGGGGNDGNTIGGDGGDGGERRPRPRPKTTGR